jgi:hypothetical protein
MTFSHGSHEKVSIAAMAAWLALCKTPSRLSVTTIGSGTRGCSTDAMKKSSATPRNEYPGNTII